MRRRLWTQLKRLMRLVSPYHVAQVALGGGHRDGRCPAEVFQSCRFQQASSVSVHLNPVSLTVAAVSQVALCVCVCRQEWVAVSAHQCGTVFTSMILLHCIVALTHCNSMTP